MKIQPRILSCDRGSEFNCAITKQLLKQMKTRMFFALGDTKAAVVERFQKTLQILIYKYLVEHETYTYFNVLQRLIKNYNETWHTTIQVSIINIFQFFAIKHKIFLFR